MKITLFAVPALIVSLLLWAAFVPKPQPVDKEVAIMQTLIMTLQQAHFEPQKIDDAFSEKVYKLYVDRLDAGRRFLTQADVQQLDVYKLQLDNQINEGSTAFFNLSNTLLDSGIVRSKSFYSELIPGPFNFTSNEDFIVDAKERPFPADVSAMREHWRKMLKYNILSKAADKIEEKELAKTTPKDVKKKGGDSFSDADRMVNVKAIILAMNNVEREALLEESRVEVEKEFNNWYKRLQKAKSTDRFSVFLNAISSVFDPHTEYYEPIEKDNFDIGMSGRLEGIGARLQTTPDGEFTKVSEIITGGPAWKQKELEADDIILKVAQNEDEPEDIAGFDINDVVKRIRGSKGTKVTLTVKKKVDSSIKTITIIRDEVIIDEGYVKSLIIEDAESKKGIGYIRLPRFYADFDKSDGRQCAIDFLKELEKLKKNNVSGIIVDLRNNGGGSLRDVVRMSGYFIEKGPIVQVKNRDTEPEVLEDTNPNVQYDGPLVIMVNEFSASASEIMAAALQDYGRAIIVGSTTFGKGTVQRFIDLDRVAESNTYKPLGQVKLTIQKFYRVNGGSTQLKGVTPDIVFPDNYSYIAVGEREAEHPLPFTSIDPEKYNQNVFRINKVDKIRKRVEADVRGNTTFQAIDKNARRVKELRDRNVVSLSLDAYLADEDRNAQLDKAYRDLLQPLSGFSLSNLPEDMPEIQTDSSKIVRNTEWITDMQKDIYLFQTLQVMNSMIKE